MKILVVDDAGVMRKVIIRELMEMGISPSSISEACDGREALEKALNNSYDLILMDWNMPNMLGIDALLAIRDAGLQTPVMMVTTEAEQANIVRAIQSGANNYLVKPFDKQSFQSKIQQVLGDPPYPEESEETAPEPVEAKAKSLVVDAKLGRISMQ